MPNPNNYNAGQSPQRMVLVDPVTLLDQGFPNGRLRVDQPEINNVYAALSLAGISTTQWAVLIDLSDTTNWPHTATGYVEISYLSLQVDKSPATQGRLQVGFITRIDATSADIQIIRGLIFDNSIDDHIERAENFSPSFIKCDAVANVATHMIGPRILNETLVQSDVALASPLGAATVLPAVGDVVVRYLHTADGPYSGAVTVLYQGVA